jgi:hypothetical protein
MPAERAGPSLSPPAAGTFHVIAAARFRLGSRDSARSPLAHGLHQHRKAAGDVQQMPGAIARAGPTIQDHTTTVTTVTYNVSLTLLMCRYSVSSMSECAAGSTSGATRANSSQQRQVFLDDHQNTESYGWRKTAANKRPFAVKGQVRSGHISCS